jgi:hypothetical protein
MQVSSVNSLDAVQKRDHAPISPLALIRLYLARLSLDCRTAQLVDKKRSKTHSAMNTVCLGIAVYWKHYFWLPCDDGEAPGNERGCINASKHPSVQHFERILDAQNSVPSSMFIVPARASPENVSHNSLHLQERGAMG